MDIDVKELHKMRNVLITSVQELRHSITAAAYNMVEIYGNDHYSVQRLNSYFPALDKQDKYINELENLINLRKYETIINTITKIQAIGDMLKDDAKSLLSSLQTGKEDIPDDIDFN
jgi:hypothetical protein